MVGRLRGNEWLQMRRLPAVLARHAVVPDWGGEQEKRSTRPVVKSALVGDYHTLLEKHVTAIAVHATRKVSKRSDHRTLDEEWDARAVSATTGTSSNSYLLRCLGRDSRNARPSDRPSKKAVLTALPRQWYLNGISKPPVNVGRGSAKPEPGNKIRALIATGDFLTFIATHGVRGMEGSGNYGGMSASQRPEVVGAFIKAAGMARMGCQFSADLDDYNWQHESWELELLWRTRARAYEALGDLASKSRATSCDYIGDSFARSVIILRNAAFRVFLGLYSGSRGTTLDNTAKHEADRLVGLDQLHMLGFTAKHHGITESGDDEWFWSWSWWEGAASIQTRRLCGERMNARKQQAGAEHGEYLQRAISGDATPRQPLTGLLATLCTGNWYRPAGTWLCSVLAGGIANWVEATHRGLPRTVAARMCGMMLDQLMIVRSEDARPQQLAWRRFACWTQPGQALFGGYPGYGAEVPPDLVIRQPMQRNWMTHGVSDYLRSDTGAWILRHMTKDWQRNQFKEGVAVDALGSCEQVYERERSNRLVAERWPVGDDFSHIEHGAPEPAPGPGLAATVSAWHKAERSGRRRTIEENLASVGVGMREATLLGGYEGVVLSLEPKKLARIKPLKDGPRISSDVACDPNILAGLVVHQASHAAFGLSDSVAPTRDIVVVAGMHGSGLSKLARRFNQGVAMRFDRLAALYSGEHGYHRPTADAVHDAMVRRRCAARVASRLRAGNHARLRMLLCHEHPMELVQVLRQHGINARWVLMLGDESERMARIEARNVAAGLLRYMHSTWRGLLVEKGYADEVHSHEEVIQLVTVK